MVQCNKTRRPERGLLNLNLIRVDKCLTSRGRRVGQRVVIGVNVPFADTQTNTLSQSHVMRVVLAVRQAQVCRLLLHDLEQCLLLVQQRLHVVSVGHFARVLRGGETQTDQMPIVMRRLGICHRDNVRVKVCGDKVECRLDVCRLERVTNLPRHWRRALIESHGHLTGRAAKQRHILDGYIHVVSYY